jgi:hypothetical protein
MREAMQEVPEGIDAGSRRSRRKGFQDPDILAIVDDRLSHGGLDRVRLAKIAIEFASGIAKPIEIRLFAFDVGKHRQRGTDVLR